MKYYSKKSKNVFSNKSFYLVLAISLFAIGGAIWSAWIGVENNTAEIEEGLDNSSYYMEPNTNSSDAQVGGEASEPYYSSEAPTSSAEEKVSPVATSFAYPVKGDISKSFSDSELKFSNTYKDMRYHEGIDINCDKGASVKSCGNGTVVAVINDALLGIYIEIDHGNGVVARYCGLNKNVTVKEGDTVKLGEKLGSVDIVPSECVDASHLHLEFFKENKAVDPLSIIK